MRRVREKRQLVSGYYTVMHAILRRKKLAGWLAGSRQKILAGKQVSNQRMVLRSTDNSQADMLVVPYRYSTSAKTEQVSYEQAKARTLLPPAFLCTHACTPPVATLSNFHSNIVEQQLVCMQQKEALDSRHPILSRTSNSVFELENVKFVWAQRQKTFTSSSSCRS